MLRSIYNYSCSQTQGEMDKDAQDSYQKSR